MEVAQGAHPAHTPDPALALFTAFKERRTLSSLTLHSRSQNYAQEWSLDKEKFKEHGDHKFKEKFKEHGDHKPSSSEMSSRSCSRLVWPNTPAS